MYTDFQSEFNLAFNNLASNQAAGLTPYEISVYLTKGQNALVDSIYENFETSEEARRKLSVLVATEQLGKLSTLSDSDFIYPEYTVAFEQPSKLRYIINEKLKMNSNANVCIRDKFIDIKPATHDEIDKLIKNPFKFNYNRAFRLDASKNNSSYIEIITKDTNVNYYQIRYIKNPTPIILEDLYDNEQIDGYTTQMNCILPESLHRQIIEIAAKLAYQDYKS
jgi:hypothetical protein